MKSTAGAIEALKNVINAKHEEDDYASFESGSLARELRKSIVRGDNEITLILAQAFVEKHISQQSTGSEKCLIYCRVSSEQQAYQSGLWRQLKTCTDYVRRMDYSIQAIFSEVASGDGDLPVRTTVERIARKRGFLIICEDHTRWSRKGKDDAPPEFVRMASVYTQRLDEALNEMLFGAPAM